MIEKLSKDLAVENHRFNVAIAELMKFSNLLVDSEQEIRNSISYELCLRSLILLLAPMAPHVCSEIWISLASRHSKIPALSDAAFSSFAGDVTQADVLQQKWPISDKSYVLDKQQKLMIISVR